VTIPITRRTDDRGHTLRVDTHEVVRVAGRLHSVDSDRDGTVRAVLEADGEGGTRSELAVELGFGGSRTDGTPGDQVGDELRAARASANTPRSKNQNRKPHRSVRNDTPT
jgi:hypothetical protein